MHMSCMTVLHLDLTTPLTVMSDFNLHNCHIKAENLDG